MPKPPKPAAEPSKQASLPAKAKVSPTLPKPAVESSKPKVEPVKEKPVQLPQTPEQRKRRYCNEIRTVIAKRQEFYNAQRNMKLLWPQQTWPKLHERLDAVMTAIEQLENTLCLRAINKFPDIILPAHVMCPASEGRKTELDTMV